MSWFRAIILCYAPKKDVPPPSDVLPSLSQPKVAAAMSAPTSPRGTGRLMPTESITAERSFSETGPALDEKVKARSFTRRSESDRWASASAATTHIKCQVSSKAAGHVPLRRTVSMWSSGDRIDRAATGGSAFAVSRTMSRSDSRRRDLAAGGGGDGVGSNSMKLRRTTSTNSGRSQHHHIMFSTSSGMLKPPQVELRLQCTLDDLCFGCVKQISVRRDIVTFAGEMNQKEEVLTVNVEPGWTKGTKITFSGSNNDKEEDGYYSSDVVFVVVEEDHKFFKRSNEKEEDLKMEVEVPLVEALTGCDAMTIPMLGNKQMSLSIDDEIITPGFEKVIKGQGMPNREDPSTRGDLRVKFHVMFPKKLTDSQLFEISKILSD